MQVSHANGIIINHFYRIDDRDDELSRPSNGIIESGRAMTLHWTENLHSRGARIRAANHHCVFLLETWTKSDKLIW